MKKTYSWMLLAMLVMTFAANAWAAPERLQIKDTNQRAKENVAKAKIKGIDLRNIEDPEARRAIGEILNYLNLSSK